MTLGQYLRLLLTGDAGVVALAGDRVHTEVLPQAPAVPAVVFTEVAGDVPGVEHVGELEAYAADLVTHAQQLLRVAKVD